MNNMFIARNLIFYPGLYQDNCQELSDEIIIPAFYLNTIIEEFEDNETLYVDLINTETNQTILVTIGTPHSYDKNTIFASQWILDLIGCSGNCDSVIKIRKADMTDIPVANRIIIKPLDPIAFEIDTLKCFETAFMNLHSIKEGITIQIPVLELGTDYVMFAHIEKVEPSSMSRIVDGEVDVEFINEFKDNSITNIIPVENTIIEPVEPAEHVESVEPIQISKEERQKQVRESWIKRYQNNGVQR